MAKFKVVTPKGTSFAVAGGGYEYENEALTPLDAEIVEIDAASENAFISAAHDADAVYAKGRNFTKRMIDGLERCKIIALGTVGCRLCRRRGGDGARHSRHQHSRHLHRGSRRPRDDADAVHRSAGCVVQDRMVREGRWREGRPALEPAAPDGPDAGLHRLRPCRAAGGDARAAVRLPHDRLRSLYRRAGDEPLWRRAGDARGTAAKIRISSRCTRRRPRMRGAC